MQDSSSVPRKELMTVDSKGMLILLFPIIVAPENKHSFQIPHFHASVAFTVTYGVI